jgi:hypothetical protein
MRRRNRWKILQCRLCQQQQGCRRILFGHFLERLPWYRDRDQDRVHYVPRGMAARARRRSRGVRSMHVRLRAGQSVWWHGCTQGPAYES